MPNLEDRLCKARVSGSVDPPHTFIRAPALIQRIQQNDARNLRSMRGALWIEKALHTVALITDTRHLMSATLPASASLAKHVPMTDFWKHTLFENLKEPFPSFGIAVQRLQSLQHRRNVIPGLEIKFDLSNGNLVEIILRIVYAAHFQGGMNERTIVLIDDNL